MIISELLILGLVLFLRKEKKSQLKTAFNCCLLCLFIWTLSSILQILFQNTSIDPFFWEKLSGFGVCLLPVAFFALGQIFAKTKIHIKWYHSLLLIIPITTIFLTLTNDYHHLIFKQYSINMNETISRRIFYSSLYIFIYLIWNKFILLFKIFN
jgi:hypothetical protein